jgi:hypothetical protein
MQMTRRVAVVASMVGVLVFGAAIAFRPSGSPSASQPAQAQTVVSESTPSAPSPSAPWGGPGPNGEPGPGASPCIEVNPGDCGIVTDYNAGQVPFKPTPFR